MLMLMFSAVKHKYEWTMDPERMFAIQPLSDTVPL